MRFGILGSTDVRLEGGQPVAVGGPRLRALLAMLVLDAGRVVTVERLIDGLYGTRPPSAAANALQALVSRLRHLLDDGTGDADGLVAHHPAGYLLAADPGDVDAHRFERLASDGRATLAAGDNRRASALLREALALWRGPALADVGDAPFAAAQAARLDEARLGTAEDHAEAELALGGHQGLVTGLQELVAAHPLRERPVGQLMRSLYACGRPAEALGTFEEYRLRLADELGADPSPGPAAIHLAVLRSDPALDAAPATASRQGLPAQLTPLIGRANELERLGALLGSREGAAGGGGAGRRLVTLIGPGGTGKTRLAVEAAERQAGDVCFVELAPLGDGAEVPRAVLGALGLRETGLLASPARTAPDTVGRQGTAPDTVGRLVTALANRRILIVLDNCEHVVDAAARLADRLLSACPGLRVLATSREPLGITGETLCPVPPLEVPPPGTPPREALGYPAVRLFADRASAVRPDFVMDDAVVETVLGICVTLDGLPLAIELAAARLRSLTAAEVAARLHDRFPLLSRGSRTAQPRHRTLRAVVEWSWDLLDGTEQTLARRLAIFVGGATLDAVERICGLPHAEGVLASLVDKSLVEVVGERFRMLDTIHAFCAERLAETGEEESLRRAHLAYFLDLAETADPHLRGAEQLEWLRRLDAEHDNLRTALHWAIKAADVEHALRLLSAQAWFWWLRGQRAQGSALARELLTRIGPEPPAGLAPEYALCVLTAASVHDVTPYQDTVLQIVDGLEEPPRQPFVLVLRAMVFGPPDRDSVVELQARLGRVTVDPWTLALGRMSMGFLKMFDGHLAEAERALIPALQEFRSVGDRWGMAQTLCALADVAAWKSDRAGYLAMTDEALDLAERLGAPADVAELLCRRGDGKAREGDWEGARADYDRAADLGRRAGAPETVAASWLGLAEIARFHGDLTEARRRCEHALAACPTDWFPAEDTRSRVYLALGWISEEEDDAAESSSWHQRALTTGFGNRNLSTTARVAEGLAGVALLEGDAVRAALLLGVGTALRGSSLEDDPDVIRVSARSRAEIGDAAYEAAHARGRAVTRDRMLAITSGAQSALTVIDEHLSAYGR